MVRRCHGHSCCGKHFLVPIAIHWECNSRPFERLTPCMHIKVTSSRNLGGPWCWNALFGNIWLSLFLMICWVQFYSFFVPRMCERMWIFVYTKNISSKRNFGTVKAGVSLFFLKLYHCSYQSTSPSFKSRKVLCRERRGIDLLFRSYCTWFSCCFSSIHMITTLLINIPKTTCTPCTIKNPFRICWKT